MVTRYVTDVLGLAFLVAMLVAALNVGVISKPEGYLLIWSNKPVYWLQK